MGWKSTERDETGIYRHVFSTNECTGLAEGKFGGLVLTKNPEGTIGMWFCPSRCKGIPVNSPRNSIQGMSEMNLLPNDVCWNGVPTLTQTLCRVYPWGLWTNCPRSVTMQLWATSWTLSRPGWNANIFCFGQFRQDFVDATKKTKSVLKTGENRFYSILKPTW